MKKIAVLLFLLSGCLHPPEGFVEIDRPDYKLAATAADGSRVFVSKYTMQEEAKVEFWAEIVERDLKARGYAPEGSEEIPGDMPGRALLFSTQYADAPYRYLVAVFTDFHLFTGWRVHIIEFAGEQAYFDRHKPAVDDFIRKYAGEQSDD